VSAGTDDETLAGYRSTIDNIDATLILLLAERFKVTKQVGVYKASVGLPPADPERENEQIARLRELSAARPRPVLQRKVPAAGARRGIRGHDGAGIGQGATGRSTADRRQPDLYTRGGGDFWADVSQGRRARTDRATAPGIARLTA